MSWSNELIIRPLQEQGVEVWYSRDSIHGADEWEKRIRQALRNCEWFLVALSANSVQSEWVRAELDWALEYRQGRILPALIGDCDPEDCNLRLRTLQRIDLRGNNPRGRAALLQIWNLHAAAPLPAISPPEPRHRRRFPRAAIAAAGIVLAVSFSAWLLFRPRSPRDDHRAANNVVNTPAPAGSSAATEGSAVSAAPLASASPAVLPPVATPAAISSGEAKALPASSSAAATARDLVGNWTNNVANVNFFSTFRKDGTMATTWTDTNSNTVIFQGNGRYTYDGKRLTYFFLPNVQEADVTWIDADHFNYLTLKSTVSGAAGVTTLMSRVK